MRKQMATVVMGGLSLILLVLACGKGGGDTKPVDPCEGLTIAVAGKVTHAQAGQSDGVIVASATGGLKAFTYSINNGAYQVSGTFGGLKKGTYTVTAKNADGCTGFSYFSVDETNVCTGTPGTLFTAVRSLLQTKCAISGCHSGAAPTGNLDLTVDCNIVLNKDNMYNRTITIGDMPQGGSLTTAEKKVITDWIAAGGRITD